MKDSTLRVVLFAIIVIFGSVILLLPIPVFYLIIGAIILGILVIFLTGTVKIPSFTLPSLKRKKGEQKSAVPEKAVQKREKEKNPKKEKKEKKVATTGKKRGAGDFFSSLKGAFAVLGKNLARGTKSKRERATQEKKIDTLLDKSISGGAVASLEDIVPDVTPAEKKKETDPFSALVGEDLNSDLLNDIEEAEDFSILDDSQIGVGEAAPGTPAPNSLGEVAGMDIGLSGDEAPIMIDETDDADEVKEILEANQGEIDLSQDAGMDLAGGAMEGLDGLDLDGIDLSEEETSVSAPAPAPAPVSPSAMKAANPVAGSPMGTSEPPKPVSPAFSPEQDMLSFSKGKGQDDDLMASLKSDVSSVKKNDYASLIRDMKDIRVNAADLKSELEDLLKPKKPRIE